MIDLSGWEAVTRRISNSSEDLQVEVGIFDPEQAAIAIHHEFGAPRAGLPKRSFFMSTFNERGDEYKALLERLVAKWMEGKIRETDIVTIAGAWAVRAIRAQITELGDFAPVTLATQVRKGSSWTRPLVRAGEKLVNSVQMRSKRIGLKIVD